MRFWRKNCISSFQLHSERDCIAPHMIIIALKQNWKIAVLWFSVLTRLINDSKPNFFTVWMINLKNHRNDRNFLDQWLTHMLITKHLFPMNNKEFRFECLFDHLCDNFLLVNISFHELDNNFYCFITSKKFSFKGKSHLN